LCRFFRNRKQGKAAQGRVLEAMNIDDEEFTQPPEPADVPAQVEPEQSEDEEPQSSSIQQKRGKKGEKKEEKGSSKMKKAPVSSSASSIESDGEGQDKKKPSKRGGKSKKSEKDETASPKKKQAKRGAKAKKTKGSDEDEECTDANERDVRPVSSTVPQPSLVPKASSAANLASLKPLKPNPQPAPEHADEQEAIDLADDGEDTKKGDLSETESEGEDEEHEAKQKAKDDNKTLANQVCLDAA